VHEILKANLTFHEIFTEAERHTQIIKMSCKKLLSQAKVEYFCVGYGLLHQINLERERKKIIRE
jgi:hypothetical protein